MWSFVHDSDLHYGYDNKTVKPRRNKELHPASILETEAAFVIVTGDLTNDGYDGAKINFGCGKYAYGGDTNQLGALIENYVTPIEKGGKDVFLCHGNHDRGKKTLLFRYRPVWQYLRKKQGSLQYVFQYRGLHFICCGKYPKDLKWLQKQLVDGKEPTILYFHFNLQGRYSDWWTDKEKDAFYDCIKDYNIVAILVGHRHVTRTSTWRGIRVISSANQYHLITYDSDHGKIVDIQARH